jgi:hypothetical protein
MGTQRVQIKGVLPWLVRWTRRAGTIDFCPALAAVLQQDFCLFYTFFPQKLQWGTTTFRTFLPILLLLASITCISPFYWLYVTFICNKRRIPLSLGWILSNVMYPMYFIVILKFNLSSIPTIPPQLFFKTCFESEAE